MNVWSKDEAQAFDAALENTTGLPLSLAMENAGRGVADVILAEGAQRVVIFCGTGNNGGDGMVAARHLAAAGVYVKVYVVGDIANGSELCRLNYDICKRLLLLGDDEAEDMCHCDCIVDAISGTGVMGALRENVTAVLERIQRRCLQPSAPLVIAVDVPTGLIADTGAVDDATLSATITVTLGAPKQGMYLYPGRNHCGRIVVQSLGIPLENVSTSFSTKYVTAESVAALLPRRSPTAHKGTNGHVVVMGGSEGMYGAPVMAAEAAVRSGAGKVTLVVPTSCLDIVTGKCIPEIMTGSYGNMLHVRMHTVDKDAVAIGPGIGRNQEASETVRNFISSFDGPLIIDADGLYALGHMDTMGEAFTRRERPAILTPHPGEFARLSGIAVEQTEASRVETVRSFATKYNVVLVLKGAPTVIGLPNGHVYINGSGNNGMGTGGMGDVLTGIIAALLAQTHDEEKAAVAGVYLHGAAADALYAERPFGFTPSEVAAAVATCVGNVTYHKGHRE